MIKKYKLKIPLLIFAALAIVTPLSLQPAGATAPAGTCRNISYQGNQKESDETLPCSSADYKIIREKISGVTTANQSKSCYQIIQREGNTSSIQAQITDCAALTITANSGGAGGGSAPQADPCAVKDPPPSCVDPAINCSDSNNGQCDLIGKYVNPFINILSICFGLLAVVSIILGGINYATSEGDPQKASKAKRRIANTIIAIVAYMFLYAFLQFLVPGGIFK